MWLTLSHPLGAIGFGRFGFAEWGSRDLSLHALSQAPFRRLCVSLGVVSYPRLACAAGVVAFGSPHWGKLWCFFFEAGSATRLPIPSRFGRAGLAFNRHPSGPRRRYTNRAATGGI